MYLLPILLLFSGLGLNAPPVHAQAPLAQDSLRVEQPAPPPGFTTPQRRCSDRFDREDEAGEIALARCSGGFGLPAVKDALRADLIGPGLRARIMGAVEARLEQ